MKVLLDTNVILDHILAYEPHKDAVGQIFEQICNDELEAVVTANSITDIYYIISKRLGDAKAREALANLFVVLGIISVDDNDCITALGLQVPDYEDALVAVCAKKDEADYIVTNDTEFLKIDANIADVISPEDLLAL